MGQGIATWLIVALLLVELALLVWLLWRGGWGDRSEETEAAVRSALAAAREEVERIVREEMRAGREEAARAGRELREEVAARQREQTEALSDAVRRLGQSQGERLEEVTRGIRALTESNEQRIERMRETVESKLGQLQTSNEKKLEEMRRTVDEQLQGTLQKRLGESFRLVSDRLEAVHKGLGEMQQLAAGVGDLKRVLTNVKSRGTWGEVQLGALLEQVLTASQFERNVRPRPGSNETVEFAIRLPGPDDDPTTAVWLPIDSKFPQEDYNRLLDASEAGDPEAVQRAVTDLTRAVESAAKDIRDKYLEPPHTTDFGIMFLPTEGLYAEVARQPALLDRLQRVFRVVPAGPTTLAAFLNSLQMGFRTLAIERRSSEVWKILAAVKSEFGKFGEVLTKVKRQLDTARNSIDQTGVRTRAIERRLREVEELPADTDTRGMLGLVELPEESVADEEEPGSAAE